MPKTANLAIMFADISESTRLFETLGDTKARATLAHALALLIAEIKRYKGTVVKTIGDEVMCTFCDTDSAIQAACSMHEKMEDGISVTNTAQQVPIKIQIGFHFGPVLVEKGDVFGDAVNIAARMVAQSKSGQIITTGSTVKLLSPAFAASVRFVDRAHVKGKKSAIDIYEMIWQEEDMTRMSTNMMQGIPKAAQAILKVKYRKKIVALDCDHLNIVIGRSQSCDLPVDETLASRQHARIELRRNKFFITDQSTNGTYISFDRAKDVFLRREEMPIHGSGRISLGRPFKEKEAVNVIHFMESLQ